MTAPSRWIGIVAALGLLLGACGVSEGPEEQSAPSVSIFGAFLESDADNFTASLEAFTKATGIEVNYTGTGSFEADLRRRVLSTANPPDIALIPQPGLVEELYGLGFVRPLSPPVVDVIAEYFPHKAVRSREVGGTAVAVPGRTDLKSLVWYRPDLFEDGGYKIPRSLGELETLSAQIEADGIAPWCISIEAEGATGWVATDWVEDLILRTAGTEVYDGWVAGDIGFTDARIEAAFDVFYELALQPGRAAGGVGRVLRTPVRDAHRLLFDEEPGCMLHRQASFAGDWLPEGIEFGTDVDFFVMPGQDPNEPPPLLIGGILAVALTDSPEAQQLLAYLATPEPGRVRTELGSYVGLQTTADAKTYYDSQDFRVVELLKESQSLRFDGSDSMPPAIGSDLLWRLITQWVAGTLPYEDMAEQLDQARGI